MPFRWKGFAGNCRYNKHADLPLFIIYRMCGILGGYKVNIDRELFKSSLDKLSHRGPDGDGIWRSGDGLCLLGHKRLAIIDLSEAGAQPMVSEDGRYSIIYNGELYNYLEIRSELETKGYSFRGNSDTEVFLLAFREWKEQCLDRFNGMWAAAIYDNVEHRLFLTRDRFGVKPLFYASLGDGVIFGSEMKALAPMLPRITPNRELLSDRTKVIRYEYTDKCLINEIRRFPAGSYAYVEDKEVRPVRWWRTMEHLIDVPSSYKEQCELFRELFIDSCRLRMRSDVTIGTALSGGLDSSATICAMAYIAREKGDASINKDFQHAFVAGFPGASIDETYYADKVIGLIYGSPGKARHKGVRKVVGY